MRFEVIDARALDPFADSAFDLVYFSASGIDAVDRAGRRAVLEEAHRTLKPDGYFVFSAHNLDHRSVGQKPWAARQLLSRSPLVVTKRLLRLPQSVANHRRLVRLSTGEPDGWAIRNDCAHNFGIVIHYVSLDQQVRDLAEVGFGSVEIFDSVHGVRVSESSQTHDSFWLHFVARKTPVTSEPAPEPVDVTPTAVTVAR